MTHAAPHASHRDLPWSASVAPGPRSPRRWPLLLILAGQAVLSAVLLFRPIVQDEATYAVAGSDQIAHLLHGAPTYAYPTFFSGAPVIYPLMSAGLNGIGGLITVRLLSLVFMLATTALCASTARRLFDARTGLLAAALFASTGAAQYLGALATYDAMSLMLLAAAAWCAVRAAGTYGAQRAALLAGVAVLLLAANATKYASALWDPIVIAMAALAETSRHGRRSGLQTAAAATAGTLLLLVTAILAGGSAYWKGIVFSTLNRTANDGKAATAILASAAGWVGILAVLAILGAVALSMSRAHDRAHKVLGWVLAAAVFLAPANQARIGVAVSLFKHVGFGAWFAAITAGYGISAVFSALAPRWARMSRQATASGFAALVLAVIAVTGIYNAHAKADIPVPYSAAAAARLRPMLAASKGMWLGDSPTVLIYYAHTSAVRWRNTYGFFYDDPVTGRRLTGRAAYADAIRRHYFGLVVLRSDRIANPIDRTIIQALHRTRGYRLTVIPETGFQRPERVLVWRYRGRAGPAQPPVRHHRHHRRHVRLLSAAATAGR